MALKQNGGNFLCPKQGNKIKGVVLNSRVCILEDFCPKHGQGFKPPATRLYRVIGGVPPPTPQPHPDKLSRDQKGQKRKKSVRKIV